MAFMGFVLTSLSLSLLEAKCSPNSDRSQQEAPTSLADVWRGWISAVAFPTSLQGPASFPILASRAMWGPSPQGEFCTARAASGEGVRFLWGDSCGPKHLNLTTKVYSRATIKVSQAAARSCWRLYFLETKKKGKKECQRSWCPGNTRVTQQRLLRINILPPESKAQSSIFFLVLVWLWTFQQLLKIPATGDCYWGQGEKAPAVEVSEALIGKKNVHGMG